MSDTATAEPVKFRSRIIEGDWADPREQYEEQYEVYAGWEPIALTVSGALVFVLEEFRSESGNSHYQLYATKRPIGKHGCLKQGSLLTRAAAKQFLMTASLFWPGVERPAVNLTDSPPV